MTDQTHPEDTLPSGGGAFVREKDGTLRLIEEPTVQAPVGPTPEEPPAAPVEAPVEAAFTSRRTPVKEA